MNSNIPLSLSPPPIPSSSSPISAPVRRHHTISSSTRPLRSSNRAVISEEPQDWDEDEYVNEDWNNTSTGTSVGVVGESKNLHRQASLPSGYNRDLRNVRSAANMANRVNSLSAITAEHAGEDENEEEDWEKEMPWNHDDNTDPHYVPAINTSARPTVQRTQTLSSISSSPLSPMFTPPHGPSPPPATPGANVRRHQSLTYGAAVGANNSGASKLARTATGGKRPGGRHGALALGVAVPRTASPVEDEDEEVEEREDSVPPSPIARAVWGDNRTGYNTNASSQDWREDNMDEIQRALGALEMRSSNSYHGQTRQPPATSLQLPPPQTITPLVSNTPPRFAASPTPSSRVPSQSYHNAYAPLGQDLHLANNFTSPSSTPGPKGPGSYAPQTGHGDNSPPSSGDSSKNSAGGPSRSNSLPSTGWEQHDQGAARNEGGYNNSPNVGVNGYNAQAAAAFGYNQIYPNTFVDPSMTIGIPSMAGLNAAMNMGAMNLNMNGMPMGGLGMGMGLVSPFASFGNGIGNGVGLQQQNRLGAMLGPPSGMGTPISPSSPHMGADTQQPNSDSLSSSIDVAALVAAKGYNPTSIDLRPAYARYFVIKSYTEDDVHKSLKYEIWSSTDPGNKRLDKAFRETAGRGPIYLFFSVNASGHFCGMAEMLTPVDYSRSSTVWAQDKWKGVFKVRWIFVRDIPNALLRGIRLENTQERKPVTNSRDTQELLPDAGSEMLRIFLTHTARTSLLQDFAYYELQSMQKAASQANGDQRPSTPPQRFTAQQQNNSIYGSPPSIHAMTTTQQQQLMQLQLQQQFVLAQQQANQSQSTSPPTRPFVPRSGSYASSNHSGGF